MGIACSLPLPPACLDVCLRLYLLLFVMAALPAVRIDSKGQYVASPSLVKLSTGRLLVALERYVVAFCRQLSGWHAGPLLLSFSWLPGSHSLMPASVPPPCSSAAGIPAEGWEGCDRGGAPSFCFPTLCSFLLLLYSLLYLLFISFTWRQGCDVGTDQGNHHEAGLLIR